MELYTVNLIVANKPIKLSVIILIVVVPSVVVPVATDAGPQ